MGDGRSTEILEAVPAKGRLQKRSPSNSLTPTLFHQDWWLDIASNHSFGVAEVRTGGRVVGRLPYAMRKRFGYDTIYMPPLTEVLGPAVDEGTGGPNKRFLNRLTVTRELIRMLPSTVAFRQKLHRANTDSLAFQSEGFTTSVIFAGEIPPTAPDTAWKNMRDKTRNVLRRAEETLSVTPLDDVDAFLHFFSRNLTARGRRNAVDLAVCRALIAASQERGCGRILCARDAGGKLEAAIFTAWGAGTAHYLMSSRMQGSGNGAVSLLLWEAIKNASSRGLTFSFDGISSEGAILFYVGFGAQIRPCYNVERSSGAFRVLQTLYRLRLDRLSGFGL